MPTTRAVIYSRQSIYTGPENESLSIEVQTRACREYIAKQGWELVGIFEDPDQKGWKVHRPAFDQMLQRFRDGGADMVVVFKLSRFARDLMHQERIIGEIADAGGELASVTEPYISTAPMVRQILGAVNEQYKRDLGDYLKASFAGRARRGFHHGPAPYGYAKADGEMEPSEPAASVVREMYAWAAQGHGSPEIAQRLNARGIGTARSGSPWSPSRVLELLRRPVYAGLIALNGEIVRDGHHEPLVDRETWETVQQIMSDMSGRYRRRSKRDPSWIDGFVWHGCGARMYAVRDRGGWRYRCGHVSYPRYIDRPVCTVAPGSMGASKIETAFAGLLTTALAAIAPPDTVIARLEASRVESDAERVRHRRRVERRITDVTAQRDRLLDMALRGSVAEDAYIARDAALRAELETLRAELAEVPGPIDHDAIAAQHIQLVSMRSAVNAAIQHAPSELPAILHAIDVRIVLGGDAPMLRWPAHLAPFFGS
jgi:DNA invertase Pin-like site-specific DNA recombinase